MSDAQADWTQVPKHIPCPECGADMRLIQPKGRPHVYACTRFPTCGGKRPLLKAWPPVPDMAAYATSAERAELRQAVMNLSRDERMSKDDIWRAIIAATPDVRPVLTSEQVRIGLEVVRKLDAEVPRISFRSAEPVKAPSCCTVVRDAYGAMTICTARMRWSLGVREHATHETHALENRGSVWRDGYESESDLTEGAEEAFIEADSRRR